MDGSGSGAKAGRNAHLSVRTLGRGSCRLLLSDFLIASIKGRNLLISALVEIEKRYIWVGASLFEPFSGVLAPFFVVGS
jgi:hypothetical protein